MGPEYCHWTSGPTRLPYDGSLSCRDVREICTSFQELLFFFFFVTIIDMLIISKLAY